MPFMMVRFLFFLILLFQGTIPILCQSIFGLLRPTHYVSIKNVGRFEAAYAFHDGTSSLFSDPSFLKGPSLYYVSPFLDI